MYSVRFKLPASVAEGDVQVYGECFDALSFSAVRQDNIHTADWWLEWVMADEPEAFFTKEIVLSYAASCGFSLRDDLQIFIDHIEDQNWLEVCYRELPAFEVGSFFVYGSHHTGAVPDNKIALQIDAATAFGSGEHGTTKGCLMALEWLKDEGLCPWQILDMGTGSGILAIAAWKLWKTPIFAVDNDPEAVKSAQHHQELNRVPSTKMDMRCALADGFQDDEVCVRAPYELIIANIQASVLKEMVVDLKSVCDENARVVLSGILEEQAENIIDIYHHHNFMLRRRIDESGWVTLIMSA